MDQVLSELPDSNQKEIHVILDNYCIHKRNNEWLTVHPNVTFHFTPTSASWLNQVETWFGIPSRKALKNASFASTDQPRSAIEAFIDVYQQNGKPFVWRKPEVKGFQLRNTINSRGVNHFKNLPSFSVTHSRKKAIFGQTQGSTSQCCRSPKIVRCYCLIV